MRFDSGILGYIFLAADVLSNGRSGDGAGGDGGAGGAGGA